MTGNKDHMEVVSVVQRHQHRCWAQKARIVAEAESAGSSFIQSADRHGVQPAQIYTWRKLLRERSANAVANDAVARLVPVQLTDESQRTGRPPQEPMSPRESNGVVDFRIGESVTVVSV